ncbi:MAG: hypothetical protein NVS2B17_14820 [Candidatus Velthaea sp.]
MLICFKNRPAPSRLQRQSNLVDKHSPAGLRYTFAIDVEDSSVDDLPGDMVRCGPDVCRLLLFVLDVSSEIRKASIRVAMSGP